ncbi:MAG: hypothetical protein KIS87_05600 [Phycisphaeraceae bacterium]|nr:hypothetical protein [Phycisphaeraceae bacterium]
MIDTNERNGTGRDGRGRFAPGCPGGPGRPRRAVEADYLRALSEACPVDAWTRIVRRAVEDAEKGDGAARAWLARYLMPDPSGARPLLGLAVDDLTGADPVAEAARQHEELRAVLDDLGGHGRAGMRDVVVEFDRRG